MAELFKWMFVDFVPLLYEKGRVAKQFQVEIWLSPSSLLKELRIRDIKTSEQDINPATRYIV